MNPSSSYSRPFFFPLILALSLLAPSPVTSVFSFSPRPHEGVVGVTYSMNTPGIPLPKQVVDALKAAGIPRVLLLDPYPDGISAFNNKGIALHMAINNTNLPSLAANKSEALRWISDNIVLPNVTIQSIAVGYDVLSVHLDLADYLLPALKNLYGAFSDLGLEEQVTISTCNSFDIITPPFPPSAARFNGSVAASYVQPLLEFLAATNSSFLVGMYPYKLFMSGAVEGTTTGMATLEPIDGKYLTDPNNGHVYDNLFDAMLDAVTGAMAKVGFRHVPVLVAGTGWLSSGSVNEPKASVLFAGEYNGRLVSRLNMRLGTPAMPGKSPVNYIHSLFDEPRGVAGVAGSEGSWGIWTNELAQKYAIDFRMRNAAANAIRLGRWLRLLPPSWLLLSLLLCGLLLLGSV